MWHVPLNLFGGGRVLLIHEGRLVFFVLEFFLIVLILFFVSDIVCSVTNGGGLKT